MVRRWGGAVGVALGVAAAAGAAQLGLAYGTGVISWPPSPETTADQAWVASLTWAAWIAATSAVAGAVVAGRLRPYAAAGGDGPDRADPASARWWRLVLAVAAGLGAVVTVVLVSVPARDSASAGISSPQAQAAGYALVGVIAGLVLAVGVLAARAVATNVVATTGWLWLLAAANVTEHVVTGEDWSRIPLGFWDLGIDQPWFRSILLPDAAVPLGAALLVGVLAALPAARRGDPPVAVAVSGAAGPLLLGVSYLLAQPDLTEVAAMDLSRHLTVPYVVLAGLAGSLCAAVVRRGAGARAGSGTAGRTDPVVPTARRGDEAERAAVPDRAAASSSPSNGSTSGGATPDATSAGTAPAATSGSTSQSSTSQSNAGGGKRGKSRRSGGSKPSATT